MSCISQIALPNGSTYDITVGGRSVSGVNSLMRFTYQSGDTNTLISTGVYCGIFTNYPESLQDGQGTLIVINYFNQNEEVSGTIGTDMLWLRQLFVSAHGGQIYERTSVERDVSEWNAVNNGGNAATANTAGTLSATSSNICLRNLSSGTAEANTTNCPSGAWYGQYEEV